MSILPLGNSSADKPGKDYQDKLNGSAALPHLHSVAEPHPELVAGGWFKEFWGPTGMCPVQLMGLLKNGEFVYFRARGKKVELEISQDINSEPHAHYLKILEIIDCELGTGILPDEICVDYIKRWLSDYIARCGAEGNRYSGKSYKVEEPAESIRI